MPDEQAPSDAIREILRVYVLKFSRALLTPECHDFMDRQIRQQVAVLEALRSEARRTKRSKHYARFCETMLLEAATATLGSLSRLRQDDLPMLQAILDRIIEGISGKSNLETLDPAAFIAFQKRAFVEH